MPLAGRLDHVAIAASRHQAILQLAGGGEVPGKPQADTEKYGGNDQPGDGHVRQHNAARLCQLNLSGLLQFGLVLAET